MEFFATLPMRKHTDKPILIHDAHNLQIGFIKRKYKNTWDKLIHYSPISLSFLGTIHIDGEMEGMRLKIREQAFTKNLTKMKWNVLINDHVSEKGVCAGR